MDFEQIEDSIISTLKAALPYAQTVETYAGQLEDSIESLPVRFPAVFVVYSGSTFAPVDGPNHRESVEFSVLAVSKNLRGDRAARKDVQGAYEMVNDVITALTNKDLGLDIEPLRPLRVSNVFAGKGLAVYGMDFETGFDNTYV
jgi:phage gp37-like protein